MANAPGPPAPRAADAARRRPRTKDARTPRPLRTVGTREVLGWKESVVLPGLGGACLLAKLDTGARTSALHAADLELHRHHAMLWVEFDLPDVAARVPRRYRLPVVEHRAVKSSIGSRQIRPVVVLALTLAGQTWTTEVTLTDRSDMELPMLIGRSALKGRFVVDPARTRLAGPHSISARVRVAGGVAPARGANR